MKRHNKHSHYTKFINMNTTSCIGCWDCITSCPKNVIAKVHFLWHKHAIIRNADNCIGCLNCIKVCKHHVFNYIKEKNEN